MSTNNIYNEYTFDEKITILSQLMKLKTLTHKQAELLAQLTEEFNNSPVNKTSKDR